MKKRRSTGLLAAGLLAAMLPSAAAAQTEAQGTVTFAGNILCDFGQGSPAPLPACEASDDGTILTLTFSNPQDRSGPFDGIQVLNGTLVGNFADGTFEVSGSSFFAGVVDGCGSGTVHFEWAGEGITDENGGLVWERNTYTTVPGGTLPVTGTIDEVSVNDATANDDGSETIAYSASYSCDEA